MDREMLGRFIAQRRKELNLTQRELAEALHVTDKAVSKWERGAGCPDISLLEPLAEALELESGLTREEEPARQARVAISSIVRTTPSTTLPPFFAVDEASSARREA